MDGDLRNVLVDVVGRDHVLVDADVRRPFEVDWTGRFVGSTPMVVRPGSVDEVARLVAVCAEHHVALVPQGGNTGLVGGGVPLHDEVVVSLRRLDDITKVDAVAGQITAGAGVTIVALQQAAAAAGWRYPVDFGARGSATLGGTIATNAGGINVLRYGSTRQQVLGIEAVLGTGAVIRRLSGLVKDNTGYHLPSLLCGSEGTLGIVTSAVMRLVPAATSQVTALVAFADVDAAVAAVGVMRSVCDQLDAAELMLADGIDVVADCFGLPQPFRQRWPAVVLVEASGGADIVAVLADVVGAIDEAADVVVADDPARSAGLWRYRELHTEAIGRLGVPHKFDITLPSDALATAISELPRVVESRVPGARAYQFGHVGDGNLHVNVLDVDDDAAGEALDGDVYGWVCEHGGCISAEHGIGAAKARWLSFDRSAAELATMRAIKRACDPHNILNPHVLVPS